ncbi:hypothetical protein M8J76_004084 [Diaphorina citri]|nr:hypothetical protein M8J76_004084 [Diaphorina citri]
MSSRKNYLIIGLSGVTCGGKSTLAAKLAAHFPPGVVTLAGLDNYFWVDNLSRLDYLPQIDHYDFDKIESLDIERYYADVQAIIERFTRNPHLSARDQILILDGFLLFNEPRLLALCTLKYDFSLPYEVAKRRRETRVYEPPDVPGYFDQVAWPAYLKHSAEIEALRTEHGIVTLDGTQDAEVIFQRVLTDVENVLKER